MVFVSPDINIGSVTQEVLYKYLLISNGTYHCKELLKKVVSCLILESFKRRKMLFKQGALKWFYGEMGMNGRGAGRLDL